jgi:O-antigen ligase
MSVAAFLGRDPFYAWTGTPERNLGVFTWVLFFAAFAAGSRLADPSRLARFVRWVVASGIALGLYTLIERWHPLIETNTDSVRLAGPYGSASFLGAALCLTLPVSVAASVGDGRAVWRRAAGLSTALGTAGLIGSGTRAAWLALCVGAVVVTAARIATVRKRGAPVERRDPDQVGRDGRLQSEQFGRLATPIVALVIGALVSIGTNATVVTRTRGASSRLDEWNLGLRIVAHHPWLGVGPEGYRTALADGVNASYERTYGRTVLPDRAHNAIIDVAATGGVPAAILYLVLAALVVTAGWRAFRRGSTLEVGLAAAAVCYLIQQIFLFPVATIDPVFWLVAGILVSVPAPAVDRAPRRWVAPIAVAALVVFFVAGVLSIAADRAARDAVESGSATAAQRAITLRPDVARYRLLAAELAPRTITGYDAAIANIERAHQITPHDPIVERSLADALTKRAIATGAAADRGASLDAWQRLADDDPNCYQCHLGLGYAAALSGDVPAATAAFQAAAGLETVGTTEAADALSGLEAIADRAGTDSNG